MRLDEFNFKSPVIKTKTSKDNSTALLVSKKFNLNLTDLLKQCTLPIVTCRHDCII